MRYAEKSWALICHAGSAPEASIGSKPLGSELVHIPVRVMGNCQGILDWPACASRCRERRRSPISGRQSLDFNHFFETLPNLGDVQGRTGVRP